MPSRRVILKSAIAVVLGLPGTVLFLPLLALGVVGGLLAIVQALASETGSTISLVLLEVAPALTWGLAGLVGLMGFWAWVFVPESITARGRIVIALCVFVGVCSVAPFIFFPSLLHSALAALGTLLGMAICLWLVLPNTLQGLSK